MNDINPKFDTGKRSEVNGLPMEDDIWNYIKFYATSDPNKCFSRRDLMDAVAKEFRISNPAAEAEGPKSPVPVFFTRISYLITDAVVGMRRAPQPLLKRLSFNVYQHITGNGVVTGEKFLHRPKLSKREVELCRVSVKILKNLTVPHSPEEIMVELGGRLWTDEVIEAAIKAEFPDFK